jgi:hypothetical protein
LKRKTPLKAGNKGLLRSTPLKRGMVPLVAKKPMARGSAQLKRNNTPIRSHSRTNANPRRGSGEAKLVRGQPCYLLVPGVLVHQLATVVPCHSNQSIHGKGMGIKAHDEFTVPGCDACHRELDQGNRFTREEKFEIWDQAYARWKPVRDQLLVEKNQKKG